MLDLPQAATSATCQRLGDGAGHTEQDGSQLCWHSHLSNAGARLCGPRENGGECDHRRDHGSAGSWIRLSA